MDASVSYDRPSDEDYTNGNDRISGLAITLDSLFYPASPQTSNVVSFGNHLIQSQEPLSSHDILESLTSTLASETHDSQAIAGDRQERVSRIAEDVAVGDESLSLEQLQLIYYRKGIEEVDLLLLVDLSPLANWKLSSNKPGNGLKQLRHDSPDLFWQLDGSNGHHSQQNTPADPTVSLTHPHLVTIQFSKRVLLERISLFMNYQLDESYTPNKIRIMAGSFEGHDLLEVCTVSFDKPVGWLHVIFNGIRNDGVLKCFTLKLIVLSNHQDGKDLHIRAIRCFGKKPTLKSEEYEANLTLENPTPWSSMDAALENVHEVIGFNEGFTSLAMTSVSRIR